MAITGAGILLWVGAAFLLTRLLAGMLDGVSAHDPVTFTLVPLVLGAVARVDPMIAPRAVPVPRNHTERSLRLSAGRWTMVTPDRRQVPGVVSFTLEDEPTGSWVDRVLRRLRRARRPERAEAWIAEGAHVPGSAEPAGWLTRRLLPWGRQGTPVGAVVPTGFAAYARVFHPATAYVGGEERLVRWSDVAACAGRSVHPEMQWEAISRPAAIPSSPQPWSHDPIAGYCGPELRGPLIEVLREETATPARCWVCVWEGWGGIGDAFPEVPRVALPDRNHLLFGASLDLLARGVLLGPGARYAGPSLWWPDDRAWCVATEVDFSWTYVGGSAACIERLLDDPRLEALPTRPEHRGDDRSDDRSAEPAHR